MRRTIPEQIKANQRASFWLLVIMLLLLGSLGSTVVGTYAPEYWWQGGLAFVGVGVVIGFVARFAGTNAVLAMSRAREITPEQDQVLANVVEEMSIAAGIPKPKTYVIEDSAPNAFATGMDPKGGVVVVTSGLLERLERDELQGVIAHEIAHIRNLDVKFLTMVAIVAGTIPLIADAYLTSLRFGSRRGRNDASIIFVVIGLLLAILAPVAAMLLKFAVSRKREFMADATAAELTRYPEGLARALKKICSCTEPLEAANRATQHMYIINPLRLDGEGSNLFSTHPPTADRIQSLMFLAGNPEPEMWPAELREVTPKTLRERVR